MDKEKLIAGVVGGIVAGFSIGVGFMIAQRTMGKFFHKKEEKDTTDVADAVAKGVTEGVKQAKIEEDAANFSNMINSKNPKRAMDKLNMMQNSRSSSFMGFDGNPNKMNFNGDPLQFGQSPNGMLNNF